MEKDIILKAENISKQYRLGQVGTGTLSHDLNRWWHKLRGKENPYLKIGDTNDRNSKGTSDYVWALRDVNFEVERGDVLGIIGKNGAGKSTLLKILSRVTAPTTGNIKFRGRVASLLEVGTGFNGEMTGRENIFLNGAILGMSKKEIASKIDEIIDFSGCERYIDTPVKRYSSGMYVRLAFAVAAHLESDILIVDEVLSVGDSEFQKKCLGKINEISKGEGRTVLFVSHNMSAVRRLCKNAIYLKNGQIEMIESVEKVLTKYELDFFDQNKNFNIDFPIKEQAKMQILKVELLVNNITKKIYTEDFLIFKFKIISKINVENAYVTIDIKDSNDDLVYWTADYSTERFKSNQSGEFILKCICPKRLLSAGFYSALFAIYSPTKGIVYFQPEFIIGFEVEDGEGVFLHKFGINHPGKTALESSWESKIV